VLLPGATITGNVIPLTEYPDPLQAAEDTVTSAFVADKVPVKDELLPTATFPKLSDDGDTASVPAVLLLGFCACEPEDTPEQPVRANEHVSANKAPMIRKFDLNIFAGTQIIDMDLETVERAKSHGRSQRADAL
jgi:hypothetical protein